MLLSAEVGKIYIEINKKNKARDDDFTKEAQKIVTMINNVISRLNTIEEACRNEFGRIRS
jgi:hypothetical protein